MVKSICLIIGFIFWGLSGTWATIPGSFIILGEMSPQELDKLEAIIEKSDLEPFRAREQRVRLTFENGFVLELLAAIELRDQGMVMDVSRYKSMDVDGYVSPVFQINPDDTLSALFQKQQFKATHSVK